MRSFNFFIALEIVIAIIIAFIILNFNFEPQVHFHNYYTEDLYSSLLSLNYLYYNKNVSNCLYINKSLYLIVNNILPNYIVYINNQLAFNNTNKYNEGFEWVYIFSYEYNNTKKYITCYINIYT